MDPRYRIDMLGPMRLVREGQAQTRFGRQKSGELLAYLALRPGPHPREQIIEQFWPDMDLPAGRNNLSVTLTGLRRLLEPAGVRKGTILVSTHAHAGLDMAFLSTDVFDFERLLDEARVSADPGVRVALLSRALLLYAADFQPGNYQDWAVREAERLSARRVEALDDLGAELEKLGKHAEAADTTRRRLEADAYLESAHVDLVRRLARAGQPGAAREAWRQCERLFADEFGAAPSAAGRRAAEDALATPAPDVTLQAPDVVPIADAAPRQKIVLDETETVSAVISETALPFWLSRFFGRQAEMAHLARLLLAPKGIPAQHDLPEAVCRLVTLTGLGGAGKTRLAAEFARQASERHGLFCLFVPLAELTDPNLILAQIAQTLRLAPSPSVSPREQVIGFLRKRDRPRAPQALLVLDNLEHLLGEPEEKTQAARPALAAVRALLTDVPSLTVLCTSRQRLGLTGERLIPLGPLPIPGGDDEPALSEAELAQLPSVQLYVDRAQSVRPDFGLTSVNAPAVASLCRALEGSPLALELAASWVRLLPPRKMWERLAQGESVPQTRHADLPPRHRSLSAALEWSWRLLTREQRRLLAQLSVFRGGWSLEAAETVCEEPRVLDLLADLQEASLVAETEGDEFRYGLLESVRQYAAERLKENEAQEEQETSGRIQEQHWKFFRDLAESSVTQMLGPNQAAWLARLEADHDNMRTAVGRCAETTPEEVLGFAATLVPFWRNGGYLREGRERLSYLLALPEAMRPTRGRAAALNGAGGLATLQAEYSQAVTLHREALSIARELEDTSQESGALHGLGDALMFSRDYPAARPPLEECLQLRRQAGDLAGAAAASHSLASLDLREGRLDDARRGYDWALQIRKMQGDRLGVARTMGGLGQVALAENDWTGAVRFQCDALRLFDEAGQRWVGALSLTGLSYVAEERGDTAHAARLLSAAQMRRERFGFPVPSVEQESHEARIRCLQTRLGAVAFEQAWEEGRSQTWDGVAEQERAKLEALVPASSG